jgi:hypothetical protein
MVGDYIARISIFIILCLLDWLTFPKAEKEKFLGNTITREYQCS